MLADVLLCHNYRNMETEKIERHNRGGRILGGLIVVAVGAILFVKQMHLAIFPWWLFTWPMLLIVLGLFVAVRSGFSGGTWLALLLVGGVFLVPMVYPGTSFSDYTWPALIIVLGLFLMVWPKRRYWNYEKKDYEKYYAKWKDTDWHSHHNYKGHTTGETSGDDYIESTSIFGEVNKIMVTRNFKGGEVESIFGGCNLNLAQADFTGTVNLTLVQIFGGVKIVVPADWKIVTKGTSIFGGIEDKRPSSIVKENPAKTLIIDATSIFGGVTIECY